MKLNSKLLYLFVIFSCFASSCGKNKKSKDDDDDTAVRFGKEIKVEKLKYYDAKADVSADGTRVAFVSGRDEAFRVYVYNSQDTTPKAARLTDTNSKLTSESEVAISPDGNWAIYVGSSSDGMDIYSRDFARANSQVQVTDNTSSESQVVFSSDSKLFAFTSRDVDAGSSKIYVGKVDATSGPQAASLVEVSGSDFYETQPVFVPYDNSGTYTILSVQRDQKTFADKIVKRVVTMATTLSVASPTTVSLLSDISFVRDVSYLASSTKIYFVSADLDADITAFSASGPGPYTTKFRAQNRAATMLLAGGKKTFLKSDGASQRSISIASSGVGAWVSRIPISCEANKVVWQSGLELYTPDEDDVLSTLLVNYTDKAFKPAKEVCLSSDEVKAKAELDGYMMSAKINWDATASDFTIVHNSLVTDDNEVRLYRRVAGVDSVISVSANASK